MTTDTTEVAAPASAPAIASASIGSRGIELRNMGDLWSFAQRAIASELCPDGIDTVEKAFIAIQMGLEVGLTPMQGLQGTAVINGTPSLYGDVAKGLVLASPYCEYIDPKPIEGTKKYDDGYGYECRAKRMDHPEVVRSFTVKDAKLAGLWGTKTRNGKPTVWTKYPDRMLMWRAQSYAIRDAFADVLRGISIKEDLESQMLPPRDVTPPEEPAPQPRSSIAALIDKAVPGSDRTVTSIVDRKTGKLIRVEEESFLTEEDKKSMDDTESTAEEPEQPAPPEEPQMPLDDEGLRAIMVEMKIPKKVFEEMVADVGMGIGIEDAKLPDLSDEGRQLFETAMREWKA